VIYAMFKVRKIGLWRRGRGLRKQGPYESCLLAPLLP
ncbi:MAG: hypothetical protein ACI8Z5_002070, partial [Lentimonas sp.]